MDKRKRAQLEKKGWKIGSTKEFLGLTDEEAAYIELKLALSRAFHQSRENHRLTQVEAARLLRSSQSRVAKMEAADPSVSLDLLIRSLLLLGATKKGLARVIGGASRSRAG